MGDDNHDDDDNEVDNNDDSNELEVLLPSGKGQDANDDTSSNSSTLSPKFFSSLVQALKEGGILEDVTDDVFNMWYKQVSCCKIAPITDENYCPKCGKKILK